MRKFVESDTPSNCRLNNNLPQMIGLSHNARVDKELTEVPAVDVFFRDIGAPDGTLHQSDLRILSEDERNRAARLHFESDRRMFVACRASLRRLLAERRQQSPEELTFEYGPRGKPSLVGIDLSFNVSHAGQWFACAISTGGPVGIDIEHIHVLEDMMAMANHFFAPAEVDRLTAIPETERTRSFFECWTRKEAVIKATGEGVSRALDSFEVTFGPDMPPSLRRIDDRLSPGWAMHSFDPALGYVAALTSPDSPIEVRSKFF